MNFNPNQGRGDSDRDFRNSGRPGDNDVRRPGSAPGRSYQQPPNYPPRNLPPQRPVGPGNQGYREPGMRQPTPNNQRNDGRYDGRYNDAPNRQRPYQSLPPAGSGRRPGGPVPPQGNRPPRNSSSVLGPGGIDGKGAPPRRKAGAPRWVFIVLDLLIVAVICGALYFYLKPKFVNKQQVQIQQSILEQMKANRSAINMTIKRDFAKVEGESYEGTAGVDYVNNANQDPNEIVSLTYFGRVVINKIQVNAPLSSETSNEALRFGVVLVSNSPNLDAPSGLTTILGHRFLTKGRDFNRLGEIVAGDTFFIDNYDKNIRYHYQVVKKEMIPAAELPARVYTEDQTRMLMLVTCDGGGGAYGADDSRILVYSTQTKTEPIPQAN